MNNKLLLQIAIREQNDNVIYGNCHVGFGERMKNIKLISIILVILSMAFLGCVNAPVATPTPTASPTATETVKPTVVPTTATSTPAPREPLIYKSFVDQYYGFKTVRLIGIDRPFVYQNLTLNISTGDTIIWVNEADPDEKLTIVSEQGLWNNTSASLRWNYQYFNYTFNQTGTYGVYIKEYPRLAHQIIIVNP